MPCVDATSPDLPHDVIIVLEGFIFQRGATIKDPDGNKALYHFQPVTITALTSTSHTKTVNIN